jgi:D-3-phosphoglycerate dehydrogenase
MKIIVTDEVSAEGLALLTQEPRIQLDMKLGLKKEELLAIIGEYDVIITRSGTTVDKALLDAGTRLKMIARAGVGIDNVDVEYASSKGVIVVNAPSATPTALPSTPWRSCSPSAATSRLPATA